MLFAPIRAITITGYHLSIKNNLMELTIENLQEWKANLKKLMFEKHGVKDFDTVCNDKEWLEDFLGGTPENAIDAETDYWEE